MVKKQAKYCPAYENGIRCRSLIEGVRLCTRHEGMHCKECGLGSCHFGTIGRTACAACKKAKRHCSFLAHAPPHTNAPLPLPPSLTSHPASRTSFFTASDPLTIEEHESNLRTCKAYNSTLAYIPCEVTFSQYEKILSQKPESYEACTFVILDGTRVDGTIVRISQGSNLSQGSSSRGGGGGAYPSQASWYSYEQ